MTGSRAEVCVVACAEAWRGDGAILASPMGVIPALGARLARQTFAADLLMTDGEAFLIDEAGNVEGWLPYRQVFTMVTAGRRHVMMGAAQIDRFGNQNISCIGDWARPKAQLLGVRGAPGNTVNHAVSYWVPRHSRRIFVEHVDMVCGVGLRPRGPEPDLHLRVVVTNLAVLDFLTPDHAMRLRSVHPGVELADVLNETGFELVVPDDVAVSRAPSAAELDLIRRLDPDGTRDKGAAVIRTALTELLGVRYPIVASAMGYVSGPKLVTAVSNAGGLGILASATMSLAELRSAIKETAAGTSGPFGVNIRADAPDAGERVAAVIGAGVPVASFALAPKPELIAALKDAGVVTIASIGARRHAEKVAAWGVDAVIATGREGGGHTGAVPTSLLIPQVVDAVDIPVIAAGGFFDGRGLVAALAYGAAGVAMGTRFLLTTDSPVADAVKRVYLAAGLDGTVVTRRVDGVPHRVLRTPLVDRLEGGGRVGTLLRSARNAVRFREVSGLSSLELLRSARAMRRGGELSWAQVLMAANTPMLLRAAMVDGRPDLGLMSSGQVAGVIEDLPSCAELIDRVMAEAEARLAALAAARA